jgi:hypothetical protein
MFKAPDYKRLAIERMAHCINNHFLLEPPEGCKYKVGDKVTFVNEYGVVFPDLQVIGFAKPDNYLHGTHFIMLDTSSYWFPHAPGELLEPDPTHKRYGYMESRDIDKIRELAQKETWG